MSIVQKPKGMHSRPSSLYIIPICATTLLVYLVYFSSAQNNQTDWLALHEIKSRINHDPLGIMSSWNDSVHFCQWAGVTCGRRHRRVTVLNLGSSELTGTLSPYIGNLSFLRVLSLYNNSFIGTIPSEIGHLYRLQSLLLYNNSFAGEIPSNLSSCSGLITLNVFNNKLVGEIPSGLGSLLSLQFLDLQSNSLTGAIPASIGNLTSLVILAMSDNNLIANIPDSLGRLKNLRGLGLFENKLSGMVPPSIFNLSLLIDMDLGANVLEGSLPLHIGYMLPSLQFFSINGNQFTGSIPASFSNCSNLQTLEFGSNNLQGHVPCFHYLQRLERFTIFKNHLGLGQSTDLDFVSCLANATMLTVFTMQQNNFQGSFPSIICNFSMLSFSGLGSNKISGQIPTCIENLAYLEVFDASGDQLSGVIPSSIGKLQNLESLTLSGNQLSGHIPYNVGNLTKLNELLLGNNNLEGPIPSALGNCKYLQLLDLSRNNLSGTIPLQLFTVSSLSIGLYLSHNPLTGSLPMEVGELKNLNTLSISNTLLSGEIPSTLGACITLEALYMQGNSFQGAIPPTFVALRGLRELDLSQNNLSGEIPKYLVDFQLQKLNLSYNHLEGEVPIGGVFNNKTGIFVIGNSGLCGGIQDLKLPPCKSENSRKRRLGHKRRSIIIAILSGVFGILFLVLAFTLLWAFCLRKRRNKPNDESETSLPNLSYGNIVKATKGFSSENLIGKGTFGIVYKAILDESRTSVAVKTFNLAQRGASKSFMAECQVLKNVRHRNLVKVITACSSVDYQGNDFKALVFEYMENGSLEDWLHQNRTSAEGTSGASIHLNVLQRIDIVMDVAFALEYLHHHSGASIVHCDLKPSNVLLDYEMVAHVGDFGLAKFLSNGISAANANQFSSVGVRGTIGYAPPEYGMGNDLSTQGGVYSFGILLLEIFTGKRPTVETFKDGLSLHNFVEAALPEHVMEILDDVLLKEIVAEEINTIEDGTYSSRRSAECRRLMVEETLTSILGIGIRCSAELPQERLDMSDVVAKLSSIRTKLLGTGLQRQRRSLPGT